MYTDPCELIHMYMDPVHMYMDPVHMYTDPVHMYTDPFHMYTDRGGGLEAWRLGYFRFITFYPRVVGG